LRDHFEVSKTYLDLAGFNFGQVTSIEPNPFGHFKLCPVARFPQLAESAPDALADITGHPQIMVGSL
jgi:hypothetical protein